jgi:hypothetical protein
MNRQQRIAFEKPCRFAFETAQKRYHVIEKNWSIIVTLNSGYE